MQFKLVPEPPADVAELATIRRAVPLVPGSEDDCCARLMDRAGVAPRDEARTWLTFLRALELVERGPAGFARTRGELDAGHLRRAFRERCYGVEELLEIVAADGPLSSEATYDRFRRHVPAYERYRYQERTDEIWRRRVDRLLEWAVLLELLERSGSRYRRP